MKKLLVVGVIVSVLGGYIWYRYFTPEPIKAVQKEVVEKIVEVQSPERLDTEIEKKKNELDDRYTKMRDLEAEITVLKAENERLDARILERQKEFADLLKATSLEN